MSKRQPRYQLSQKIGGRYLVYQALMGGMGEVYLCLDEEYMVPVALKTFQQRFFADTSLQKHFEDEVANWIALEKHTNIVRCHYMDIVDSTPFMFLEWVAGHESKGTSLRQWVRHGPLDLKTALNVTIGILRGLRHADAKNPGVVHRDLKPDNVLLTQDGTAKITDFGLAKVVGDTPGVSPDASGIEDAFVGSVRRGAVVGTPPYMPPEQWRGEPVSFKADVYAVGCILYEILTGHMAFPIPAGVTTQNEFMRAMEHLHQSGQRTPLPDHFPAELNRQMLACLHPDPDWRPVSVTGLIDMLAAIYEASIGERPSDEPQTESMTAAEYSNRGVTYGNLGQHERAIADLDEALRLDPTDATAYYCRGKTYGELGQHERAIADFNQAIDLDPTLSLAHCGRGNSYDALRQYKRAIADFDRAIDLDPTETNTYIGRGNHYADLDQHERAIADFDRAIDLDPADANTYNNRGNSYMSLGRHEQAIIDFDRAIDLDPTDAEVYSNRGANYGALEQHERAIADFNRAIDLDPTLAQVYVNRGASYGALEQYEQAIADFDRAIDLDPTLAQAWFNKGAILAKIGNLQKSLPCFEQAYVLGIQQAASIIQQIRQALGQTPTQSTNNPQAVFDAFLRAESLDAMRQTVQQFPILAQMIPIIEQTIAQQIPPQSRHTFEKQLTWLRQIVGIAPQVNSSIEEQERMIRQLVSIYQQVGEAGLRQLFQQQNTPTEIANQLIDIVQQALGGT